MSRGPGGKRTGTASLVPRKEYRRAEPGTRKSTGGASPLFSPVVYTAKSNTSTHSPGTRCAARAAKCL
eukprot:2214252-Rhodomonas_salina.2